MYIRSADNDNDDDDDDDDDDGEVWPDLITASEEGGGLLSRLRTPVLSCLVRVCVIRFGS